MSQSIFKRLNLLDFFGAFIGIVLFIVGAFRISTGISSIRISDAYTAHFMNVGLLYLSLAFIIIIIFAIKITHSLNKK
ncbi:hypothetical protein GOV03_03965 [Candidatus Woesearchaeota archaeon]|nr:hypothetical protein [Candidatus Woesearchaeota archaeon]